MTTPDYELVVTLLDGDAREVSRTFESGKGHAPFSVGLQGDWIVAAEGVANVHLWLEFDGQQLYAACAAGATAYVLDQRLDEARREVPARSELRFGQARMKVFRRSPALARPGTPQPDVAHRADAQRPVLAVRAEPLSPMERAAALPLPRFFRDRLGAGSIARPVVPEPDRARARGLPAAASRVMTPVNGGSLRARRTGPKWPLVAIPALVLPLLAGLLWLTSFRGHRQLSGAVPGPSATAPAPAGTASVTRTEQPRAEVPLPPLPALETQAVLPVAPSDVSPPKAPVPMPQKAYRQDVTDKPVPRIGAEPSTISEEWRAHHERQLHAPNRAAAKVIFLGDSITEGWGVAPAYRDRFDKYKPLNLGISGDFTQNVLWRIDQGALSGTNPEALVLMIGVNNLAGGFSPKETVAGIRAIVAAVQTRLPNTQVLLLAILPARQSPGDPLRQRIIEANGLLAGLAGLARVRIHDVGAVLLEPDGTLSKTTTRDFLHPTAAGYERLSEAVAPLLDTLLGHMAE
ncbi:MAG: GDSL-type esterase/lipase family protein [Pseudomonadota bacterium]